MRTMKDSGIEWIGEIPQEWNTTRIKYCTEIDREKLSEKTDPEYTFQYIDISGVTEYGGIGQTTEMTFEKSPSRARMVVKPGDTIISTVRTYLKAVAYIDSLGDHICSTGFCVLSPKKDLFPKFAYYVLQSDYVVQKIVSESVGVSYPAISSTEIGDIKIALPEYVVQARIADYLDTKCAEIDALIAAKEKTNALLKERRQSIIYEAVTKGLDPTVPMKDSGVEWIGEIPEGWSVCRIKRVAEIVTGNTPSKASGDLNYSDDGLMWVKPDNLLGNVPVKDTSEHLSDDGCMLAKVVPANTPLTCCIGTIGKVGYSEKAGAFNQQINAICFEESVNTRFGLYCLMAQDEQQKCFANGNVLKILNAEAQGRLFIAIPSLSEQRIIAEHLDMQCQMIDENCAANNVTIQKLKEYRQSLIYEAVTGKIEV